MQRRERSAARLVERTDGVLAEQALAGDERAFESLVQRYHASLFVCIYRYLGDYDQTCDVLQEVWLQLSRSLPTLRMEKPLLPWLSQVARNRCLDALRRRQRKPTVYFSELEREADEERSLLASLPDVRPLPEEIAEHYELQHVLHQAIQTLPPKFRTVVLLRYAGQMSFAEIGQVLQIPATTAKTHCYRARLRLAALLIAWDP
jgi:RNA polymerase sigma-70 factor (ECF subfamily)